MVVVFVLDVYSINLENLNRLSMLKITPERPLCSAKTERYAIVHGNGKYIAVDKRGYMNTSSDGRTWSNPDIIGCPADWHLLHLPAVNM